MSLKRDLHYHTRPTARRAILTVSEVMKQIEVMSGIRKRIREGYYNRHEILTEIAEQLSCRLNA